MPARAAATAFSPGRNFANSRAPAPRARKTVAVPLQELERVSHGDAMRSSPSCSEAPPADELDLVVLVVSALRPAAGIDALEVGAREVVAQCEREGAGRPPETGFGLEVVHTEEVLSRGAQGVGEKAAGDRRPVAIERKLLAAGPAQTQSVRQVELRVDPAPEALRRY